MLYDTHCHPYLLREKSSEEALKRFFYTKNRFLNSIGVDIESSETSISLAKKHQNIYASIGIHPTNCLEYKGKIQETMKTLENLYGNNSSSIVAVGECGLDYHWLSSLSEKYNLPTEEIQDIQIQFFRAQIQLAQKLNLPFIIHNRKSSEDVYKIIREEGYNNFVFHCYSDNYDYAIKLLELSPHCKLGFGGTTTFKKTVEIQETVSQIPLTNIIIETDAPYLTPMPFRGKEENEPQFTQFILEKIIELRSESPEEITQTIFNNSIETFIKK